LCIGSLGVSGIPEDFCVKKGGQRAWRLDKNDFRDGSAAGQLSLTATKIS
jgi:hypothetical protein